MCGISESPKRMLHPILRIEHRKLSHCQTLWNRLFIHTPRSSPFVSFAWFDCLARFILHTDPEILLVYDRDTCVGIVPVHIADGTVRFITDERVTDVTGFVYLPRYADDIARALASFTKQEGLRIELYPVEQNDPLVHRLADCLSNAALTRADVNPLLELPVSWNDYLATLTSKSRHELRRKLRKGHAVRLETSAPNAIESLFELMAHDARKRQFLTPEMRAFFAAITTHFFRNGWLRLRCASIGNTLVAALLTFSHHRCTYLYNMGINPQYTPLSPGIVAIALDIESAIIEGNRYYDFLRGDEEYKFRFGARKQYTVSLQA